MPEPKVVIVLAIKRYAEQHRRTSAACRHILSSRPDHIWDRFAVVHRYGPDDEDDPQEPYTAFQGRRNAIVAIREWDKVQELMDEQAALYEARAETDLSGPPAEDELAWER